MKFSVIHKASKLLNAWFDDLTLRFRIITIIAGVLVTFMTLILFLEPVITKVKAMPVNRYNMQSMPNIILIVADALSANDMSLFGYPLPTTPTLDEIVQKWTVYSNAQSPQTCSVAALPAFVTGRYAYLNSFSYYGDQVISHPGWLSLPNTLDQAGYQTWWNGYLSPGFYHMGTVFEKNVCQKDDNLLVTLSHSWFKFQAILISQFPYIPFTMDQLGIIEAGKTLFDQCDSLAPLESLLQSKETPTPFFIFYHYSGAHGIPYPSARFLGTFLPESEDLISLIDQSRVYGAYKPEDQTTVDKLRLRYDEGIANQDQQIGAFIDSIKRQGLYDSSMIILTSDHGQNFANGFSSHCTPLVSNMEAHVPLLIKYPNQTQGQRFDSLVSTLDIVPTILDVVGMEYPSNWLDGVSLLKQADQPDPNRIVFTRRYSYDTKLIPAEIAASDGRYRLVERIDKQFLFDITNDPLEKTNLLDQRSFEQSIEFKRLQQALENYRQRSRLLLEGEDILNVPLLHP